jgi:glucose/arabinose dehydrogenase
MVPVRCFLFQGAFIFYCYNLVRLKLTGETMKISSAFILLASVMIVSGCVSSGNAPARTPVATFTPALAATRAATSTATATTQPTATTLPQPVLQPTPAAEVTSLPRPALDAPNRMFEIDLTPIVEGGLTRPAYLTHAGDDRLFVVEQPGRIRIVKAGQLLEQPFLDITDKVTTDGNEQGLLSVAFHPDYKNNEQFFVNYTRQKDGATVVERYTISKDDPDRADDQSGQVILTIAQPEQNHNGGLIKFGPDGYLYIGMGDGGGAGDRHGAIGNGQDLNSLLGKMLRIDVTNQDTYAIPVSNPRGNEIWAYGLRNPWRFSFDRSTGDLYIADVGQNTYEEVDFQAASSKGGENYGWRIMEGLHCYDPSEGCDQSGLVLPIAEYSHAEGGCSITGGYVYRGLQYPVLDGAYFFGDYCTGFIWSLQRAGDQWQLTKRLESGVRISSFGEDVNGELYVIDHGGAVYQLVAK